MLKRGELAAFPHVGCFTVNSLAIREKRFLYHGKCLKNSSSTFMRATIRLLNSVFLIIWLLTCSAALAGGQVQRPRIVGVAHMALYVSDLGKARAFYEDFLGYAEPYVLKRDDGSERIAFIKINEDQYLELFAEPVKKEGHLNHISIQTDSAERMREYLAAQGVKVPNQVGKGKIGNSNFNITDPDGHSVEIVQYEPDSWTRQQIGKYIPDTRFSTQMRHVGVTVGPLAPAIKFY